MSTKRVEGGSGPKVMKTSVNGYWADESTSTGCYLCGGSFSVFRQKHHCRECGQLVCGACSPHRKHYVGFADTQRNCNACNARAEAMERRKQQHVAEASGLDDAAEVSAVAVAAAGENAEGPQPRSRKNSGVGMSGGNLAPGMASLGVFLSEGRRRSIAEKGGAGAGGGAGHSESRRSSLASSTGKGRGRGSMDGEEDDAGFISASHAWRAEAEAAAAAAVSGRATPTAVVIGAAGAGSVGGTRSRSGSNASAPGTGAVTGALGTGAGPGPKGPAGGRLPPRHGPSASAHPSDSSGAPGGGAGGRSRTSSLAGSAAGAGDAEAAASSSAGHPSSSSSKALRSGSPDAADSEGVAGLTLEASTALDAAAVEESIESLRRHRLRGRYELTLLFLHVFSGGADGSSGDPAATGTGTAGPGGRKGSSGSVGPPPGSKASSLSTFKTAAAARAVFGKEGAEAEAVASRVKPGTRLRLMLTIRPVGNTIFCAGHAPDGGPFGEDGHLRGTVQLSDGISLFCLDFPQGAKGHAHQMKMTGMMDHTSQIYGNFTACELSDAGRAFAGHFHLTEHVPDGSDSEEEDEVSAEEEARVSQGGPGRRETAPRPGASSSGSSSPSSSEEEDGDAAARQRRLEVAAARRRRRAGSPPQLTRAEWVQFFEAGFPGLFLPHQNCVFPARKKAHRGGGARAAKDLLESDSDSSSSSSEGEGKGGGRVR